MSNPLVKNLSARAPLSDQEQRVLVAAIAATKQIGADAEIIAEGSEPAHSILLLEGFAARFKATQEGKRQILSVHIKGDFVDLHSFLLQPMDHGVFALSPCTVALVPHERIRDITERFPHLTRQLWLSTLVDGAIHREWLLSLGRRPAVSRLAHLICEIFMRLQVVGETIDNRFRLPITQEELADITGMSIVHLNRSVQELRARQLIVWRGEEVTINQWDGLAATAGFDPKYLRLPS